jgi:hypothetical protein
MELNLSDREYATFYNALRFTIPHEGGYVNDPLDLGGETKWGISKKYHPTLDIENLTPEEAAEIYYKEYWVPSGACDLGTPLNTLVFDTAVLCGVSRAADWLKESNGNYQAFLSLREQFHKARVAARPDQNRFLGGWLNRVRDLEVLNTIYA